MQIHQSVYISYSELFQNCERADIKGILPQSFFARDSSNQAV